MSKTMHDLQQSALPDHRLSSADETRFRELFRQLDVNGDGRIDIHDLSEALHRLRVHQLPNHAQKLMDKYDPCGDGHVSFEDFVRYVTEHEKALRLSFESLDHKRDGYIDIDEMVVMFKQMGVNIDHSEAKQFIRRVDRDNTLVVTWDEWREFLLLHPSSNIHDIFIYWRHATMIDIGEPATVPDDFTEGELRSGDWWRNLVAGGAAGAVSRTCTAPLDRLKLFLMVHGSKKNGLGLISSLKLLLNEGGVRSMWRGNGMNVLKIAPESALKFMAYEQIKRLMKRGSRDLSIFERFLAGSTAGVFSQTAIYPLEVLKTRLALRKTGDFRGIVDCASKLYQREGSRCFFRGYLTNVLGIVPYAGIDLAVYETLKRSYIRQHSPDADPSIIVLLACGTLSSTCGQLASYPLALVRTKLQANVNKSPDTMTGLFKAILKNEGFFGLYRGLVPNFLKVAPAVSISYVVYEHVRKALGVEMT